MSDDRKEQAFSYAILRVVPRIERGEAMNVGVVVFAPEPDYLGVRLRLDEGRLLALDPACDPETVRAKLAALSVVAAGEGDGGILAGLPASDRFGWLTTPSSEMIQPSEVQDGVTHDPAATLDQLFDKLVG